MAGRSPLYPTVLILPSEGLVLGRQLRMNQPSYFLQMQWLSRVDEVTGRRQRERYKYWQTL
jgi:hypothetical protein